MNRQKWTPFISAVVLSASLAGAETAGGQIDTLTLIHVNDSHANLAPFGAAGYGGIARAAAVIGEWKATEPNPILIHGGDFQVGTLMFNAYFGVPELQMLNILGFDVLCLGNHEFDTGPEQLAGLLALAGLDSSFNILCTNAVNLDSVPMLKAFIRSYAIEQRGGIKIGILGLTTPAANAESNPAPVLLSDQIPAILGRSIMELKTMGCQVVILVSHLGLTLDRELAAGLSGVDAIIGAHSHDALTDVDMVNGIPIVQAGEFYRYVGKLRLAVDAAGSRVLDYTLQEITSDLPAEPVIEATVSQLKAGVAARFDSAVGNPDRVLSIAPRLLVDAPAAFDTLDTPLGNLVTAAMLSSITGADCAIEAGGHIVENLYPGPVTTSDLFRIYPYGYNASDGLGFRLASFDLAGAEILGTIQALLRFVNPQTRSFDYLLQSCGLDFTVDASDPAAGLRLAGAWIHNKPVDPDSVYTLASSSQIVGYLQNLFEITPRNLTVYPVSVFSVIEQYVASMDTLRFRRTGHNRVSTVNGIQTGRTESPAGFDLEPNFPNPFNGETVIRLNLAAPGRVQAAVYDPRGRRVAVLVPDQMLPAGEQRMRFNADALPSGVYLVKATSRGISRTRKMLLLR
jgi:5'-nucleotidase / UDP-sugar diphosphatase